MQSRVNAMYCGAIFVVKTLPKAQSNPGSKCKNSSCRSNVESNVHQFPGSVGMMLRTGASRDIGLTSTVGSEFLRIQEHQSFVNPTPNVSFYFLAYNSLGLKYLCFHSSDRPYFFGPTLQFLSPFWKKIMKRPFLCMTIFNESFWKCQNS